jgi:hypothetical protein
VYVRRLHIIEARTTWRATGARKKVREGYAGHISLQTTMAVDIIVAILSSSGVRDGPGALPVFSAFPPSAVTALVRSTV